MKHYCLKPKAKETLKEVLIAIFFKLPLGVLIASSMLWFLLLPFVLITGHPNDVFELTLAPLGILSWTAVFSAITISIKRWLQSNIIEC